MTIVSPTSTPALMKKAKHAFCNAQLHCETVDLDALDTGLSRFDEETDDGSNQDDNGDNEESPEVGVWDTIGKALALVKQVGQLQSNSIIYINSASQIQSSSQARTVRGPPLGYLSPLSFLPFMDYLLLLSPVPSIFHLLPLFPSFFPGLYFYVVWPYGPAVAI
jgi:hypothetical protein